MNPIAGNVGKFLHRGSKKDCAYPLLSIEHQNDSYATEARAIMLIRYWVSSTIMIL